MKLPSFGLPADGKKRWCNDCAKGHAGAVDVQNKKCEGCGLTQPNFGLPADGKARWCFGCAKAYTGAVNVNAKKCEDCGRKARSFRLPGEGKMRWCSDCMKAYDTDTAHDGDRKSVVCCIVRYST